jgi:hypothetical protein
MAKWADWCITAVSYDEDGQHIVKVKARPDEGKGLGAERVFTREQVVNAIEKGTSVVTAPPTKGVPDSCDKGAKVDVVRRKYLTTDPNDTTRDNLGKLPEF